MKQPVIVMPLCRSRRISHIADLRLKIWHRYAETYPVVLIFNASFLFAIPASITKFAHRFFLRILTYSIFTKHIAFSVLCGQSRHYFYETYFGLNSYFVISWPLERNLLLSLYTAPHQQFCTLSIACSLSHYFVVMGTKTVLHALP